MVPAAQLNFPGVVKTGEEVTYRFTYTSGNGLAISAHDSGAPLDAMTPRSLSNPAAMSAHGAQGYSNRFCHDASDGGAQQISSQSSIHESWKDCTIIRLSTCAMPGAFAAARSALPRCSQVSTVPVSVAVSPDTTTVM